MFGGNGISLLSLVLGRTSVTVSTLSNMIKIAVVALALLGVALAYEHHGFISEVKHIPYYGGGGGFEMGGGGLVSF